MGIVLNIDNVQKRPYAYAGFDEQRRGWPFPRPANMHTHLRDPDAEADIFDLVLPETAKVYSLAVAMPNLGKNRILTGDQSRAYRDRILERAGLPQRRFDVVVPFCVEEDLDLSDLQQAFADGVLLAGKLYPKNGTTNSSWGVDFRRIRELFPLFGLMQEYDRILLVHAEAVTYANGRLVEDRLREQRAIATIDLVLRSFPRLRVVFEHISSRHSVAAVKQWQAEGFRIEATIAPQYLLWDSTALFEGGMNPARFSIPILKDHRDRMALIRFLVEGGGMLGTDSAPHNVWKKSQAMCCPGGVFNEPVSIHVYFHVFRKHGGADWFERFVEFASFTGPRFYGLPVSVGMVLMKEKSWTVKEVYGKPGADVYTSVIPLLGGDRVPTSLMPC